MGALLKVVAVILWLVAVFLVYAVIHAVSSAGGARVGVAIGYIAGAIVLSALGAWAWRGRARPTSA
jgi:multisubunit Na+/H+ antiporter MnhB subunit